MTSFGPFSRLFASMACLIMFHPLSTALKSYFLKENLGRVPKSTHFQGKGARESWTTTRSKITHSVQDKGDFMTLGMRGMTPLTLQMEGFMGHSSINFILL